MLNKKNWYMNFIPFLIILIPAPGRFAYGLVLILEYIILVIANLSFSKLIEKLKLTKIKFVLLLFSSISLAVLMKLILVFISPVTAMQLGFIMMIPAVVVGTVNYYYFEKTFLTNSNIKDIIFLTLYFAIFGLLFFLLRDIAGYGTLTIFTTTGIHQIILLHTDNLLFLTFLATIPGSLIFATLFIYFIQYCSNKIQNTAESAAIKKEEMSNE